MNTVIATMVMMGIGLWVNVPVWGGGYSMVQDGSCQRQGSRRYCIL